MHATNYTGVIAIIRAAAKVLRDNGRIISIGSGIGTRAGTPGFTDYAATKAGLLSIRAPRPVRKTRADTLSPSNVRRSPTLSPSTPGPVYEATTTAAPSGS
jgi:NAD(P)-dependent dehydrogenase (short-subunit alcohol dehydrogenase family)